MSGLSTHVLDTARGLPAAGLGVRVEVEEASGWRELARATTDADGRVPHLLGGEGAPALAAATYRLTFDTGAWFATHGVEGFYPCVVVTVTVRDVGRHHHVPLLLAPYGYSTYRGS
jgi:5-hydroxyisourate hydrolase